MIVRRTNKNKVLTREEQRERRLGLGDAVEIVAKPIGKILGIENCSGCTGPGGRKERLNAAIPDVMHPFQK